MKPSALTGKFFIDCGGREGVITEPVDRDGYFWLVSFPADGTMAVTDVTDMCDWILFETAEARSAFMRRSETKLRVIPLRGNEPA